MQKAFKLILLVVSLSLLVGSACIASEQKRCDPSSGNWPWCLQHPEKENDCDPSSGNWPWCQTPHDDHDD
jgi:hypothetical protein